MATIAETLVAGYAREKSINPSITKGQYMQRVFKGRYKNEKNANDAYRRTVEKERSGRFINIANKPKQPPMTRLSWKIIVHFNYIDHDGQEHTDEERSFIATSDQYTQFTDRPYIEDITMEAAEEYMEYWHESGSPPMEDSQITYIEAIPIFGFQSKNKIDLDEIEIGT
jgi:hypothetical protein